MKSSRSRRSDLNGLSKEEVRIAQSTQQTSKSYGFSLFGRTKPSKSPRKVSSGEGDVRSITTGPTTPDEEAQRSSLASRHYRTMSRSMSDLGSMINRASLSETHLTRKQTTTSAVQQLSLPVGAVGDTSSLAVEQEDDSLEYEVFPFPLTSIVFYGWLNKRGSKKEASWKLHQVYLRESKLYAYKPPIDLGIRAFDISLNESTAPTSSNSVRTPNQDAELRPESFGQDTRSLLFDNKNSDVTPRFLTKHNIRELGSVLDVQTEYLALLCQTQLILCKRNSLYEISNRSVRSLNRSAGVSVGDELDLWELHCAMDLDDLELELNGEELVLRSQSSQRRFRSATGHSLRNFFNRCHSRQAEVRGQPRPSTAPTLSGSKSHSENLAIVDDLRVDSNPETLRRSLGTDLGAVLRRLLLFKGLIADDPVLSVIVPTIGFLSPPQVFILELADQIKFLGDSIHPARPVEILSSIISMSSSILLRSETVEALLVTIDLVQETDQAELRDLLWARRAAISAVISMDGMQTQEDAEESDWADELHTIQQNGLQAETVLAIPANIFAAQLRLFHQYYLEHWDPSKDKCLFFGPIRGSNPRNPLVFSHRNMHFLTWIIYSQILCLESSAVSAERRATICTRWILIGIILKRTGDMTGWLAIAMALCSPSIIRLKEMWTRIESRLRTIVQKEWSPVIFDLSRRSLGSNHEGFGHAHVLAPDVSNLAVSIDEIVPFYGDICDALDNLRSKAHSTDPSPKSLHLELLPSAHEVIQTALEDYRLFLLRVRGVTSTEAYDRTQAIPAFQECFRQLNSIHLEHPDTCSAELMEASLRSEPARIDLHVQINDYGNVIGTSSYLPLLFVDQLPAYRLFEAADILSINNVVKRPRLQNTQSGTQPQNKAFAGHLGGEPMRRLNSFPPTQRPTSHTTGHDLLDEATRLRTAASVSQWKMLKHVKDIAGVSDQAMILASGKLILKDFDGEKQTTRKRPQSVLMEARKRDSTISRRSSLQLSDTTVLDDDLEIPVRSYKNVFRQKSARELVVKAASLDMLFDLLLLDVEDMPGLEIKIETQSSHVPEASLDRSEYIRIFLFSYRSYCGPTELIEALTYRMLRVFEACQNLPDEISHVLNWSAETSGIPADINWRLVENLLAGICEVFSVWLASIPADFTTSHKMFGALNRFLLAAEQQLEKLEALTSTNRLIGNCKNLLTSHIKKIRRQALRVCHTPQSWQASIQEFLDQETDLSELDITCSSDLAHIYDDLKQLDQLVEFVLQSVSLADWMICYEALELQALDPYGFLHNITELIALDQDVPIHDSIWLLEHSVSKLGKKLLESMPRPIRDMIWLRNNITRWTTGLITQLGLSLGDRVERIEYFLRMLGLSSKCMSQFDIRVTATEHTSYKTQIVPSFVAAAITAGLHHPDSRSFALAWSIVAQRGCKEEQASSIIPLIPDLGHFSEGTEPIVPCIAWILDRMLEIACYIPNRLLDNPSLFNFDKRRYLCNLLSNLDLDGVVTSHLDTDTMSSNRFHFLLGSIRDSGDRKLLRAAATKEDTSTKGHRLLRPFGRLVQLEHEKARRDLRLRDDIGKQLRDLDRLATRKKEEANKLLDPKRQQAARSRYGMNSLLRAVRPLSVAISGTWTPDKHPGLARVVPPSELPKHCSTAKGTKPALSIDLVNSIATSQDRANHTFKIRTEDGLDVCFQAPTLADMDSWIKHLAATSRSGSQKRVSIIREDAKLASIEETPQFSPRNSVIMSGSTATFGMQLTVLIRRDACSIPRIATLLLSEIETRGLQEVGIYRISGSLSTINALKRSIDSNPSINSSLLSSVDINAIASLFKLWLRELPEPLMTYDLYTSFLATLEIEEYDAKLLLLKELIHRLPVPNFSMLKRLIEHLEKVTDYEAYNHMYAHNLAIVFGPNILQPTPSNMSFAASMNDIGKIQTIIRNIILQCHWIFSTEDSIDIDLSKASALPSRQDRLTSDFPEI